MAFFKQAAIMSVTRKRARKLLDALGPPNADMLGTVKDWVRATESIAGFGDSFGLELDKFTDWMVLFYTIICMAVFSELKYDRTIGSDEDIEICKKYVIEEIAIWAQKHGRNPADII
jgi:hypothetical protein